MIRGRRSPMCGREWGQPELACHTGVIHVHTSFSDGDLSVRQIASLARAQNLSFVVFSDHARQVTPQAFRTLCRHCAALSDESLLLLPGLEFEGDGRHVVALGPPALLERLDHETVVHAPERVRQQGGLTIWAHPALTFGPTKPARKAAYDGWEVWNGKAGGQRPDWLVLKDLRKSLGQSRALLCLAGTDFHRGNFMRGPQLVVEMAGELNAEALWRSLREGSYAIHGWGCRVSSAGEVCGLTTWGKVASASRHARTRLYCALALLKHRTLLAAGLRRGDGRRSQDAKGNTA